MQRSQPQHFRNRLLTPIQYVKGVGPKLAKLFEKKGNSYGGGCPLLSPEMLRRPEKFEEDFRAESRKKRDRFW